MNVTVAKRSGAFLVLACLVAIPWATVADCEDRLTILSTEGWGTVFHPAHERTAECPFPGYAMATYHWADPALPGEQFLAESDVVVVRFNLATEDRVVKGHRILALFQKYDDEDIERTDTSVEAFYLYIENVAYVQTEESGYYEIVVSTAYFPYQGYYRLLIWPYTVFPLECQQIVDGGFVIDIRAP